MVSDVFKGLEGVEYTLGQKIGQGGEGTIYLIQEDAHSVVKLYIDPLSASKVEKLLFMISRQDEDLLNFTAWPTDVVKDATGKYRGIIMRKLDAYVPLHNLFSPINRKQIFPNKGYDFLIRVAQNLAIAFHKIHGQGVVIGDVNEANILVDAKGIVAFIDCDSFQLKSPDKYFFCEVGVPRYTPPELFFKGTFNQVVRTENTDNFSLATLIFQLLFLGRAPFVGINLTDIEINEEQAIAQHEFAYSLRNKAKKLHVPKNALTLEALPIGIQNLFHAAFEDTNNRPSTSSWIEELEKLSLALNVCTEVVIHAYPAIMETCPWCQFKKEAKIYYFLEDDVVQGRFEIEDIASFVHGFDVAKLEVAPFTSYFWRPGIVADPIPFKYRFNKLMHIGIILAIMLISGVCMMYVSTGITMVGLILIAKYSSWSPLRQVLRNELIVREDRFNRPKVAFDNFVRTFNEQPVIKKYQEAILVFSNQMDVFKQLPDDFEIEKKEIEEKYFSDNLGVYLSKFDILEAPMLRLSHGKRKLLYEHGIKNARDIDNLKQFKISGIKAQDRAILEEWRRHLTTDFTYLPDVDLMNKDLEGIATDFNYRKTVLTTAISRDYKYLMSNYPDVYNKTNELVPYYEELAEDVCYAYLNLEAFRNRFF